MSTSRLVRRVAITGGTHGNELCGVSLANYFISNPKVHTYPTFETVYALTNEEAIKRNTRYVDMDLNRCFSLKSLAETPLADWPCERKVAQELNTKFGPKGSDEPKVDFIFDLHNTTANTGVLLCFHPEDELANEVAAHAQQLDPAVQLNHWLVDEDGDVPFLPSISASGMTVEVGPVAHGTVHSEVVQMAAKLLKNCLTYLDRRNELLNSETPKKKQLVEANVSSRLTMVDYPRQENGEIAAYIHPDLQGVQELTKESTIKPGDNLFLKLDGSAIQFDPSKYGITEEQVSDGLYPLFVNEAAYYEKGIALMLTKQTKYQIGVYP